VPSLHSRTKLLRVKVGFVRVSREGAAKAPQIGSRTKKLVSCMVAVK
jgi:hypothetical protein